MYPVPSGEARLIMVDALESNPSGRRTIIRNHITTGISSQGHIAVPQPVVTATKTKKRTSKKDRIKSSTVAIYASIFALVISVVAMGYRAPQETAQAGSTAVANTVTTVSAPTANDVVAAQIAASVASVAELAVAGNVAELAIATEVQSQYASTDDGSSVVKPAIVELSSATRNIETYTVESGDSVASVAATFAISEQTLRWANDLDDGEAISSGDVLDILPVNGIVYVVESGDTAEKLADKYGGDAGIIISFNNLEFSGLSEGLKIIIPGGELPDEEQPGYTAPAATTTGTSGTFITGYSSGWGGTKTWFIKAGTPNRGAYAYGNCTAYSFDRRAELGRPIGARWGNAGSWAVNAMNDGYVVNRTPAAGAVIQDWGHVGIVERVLPNGDLEISEMNAYVSGGGFNIVSGRILPASQVSQYYYIH